MEGDLGCPSGRVVAWSIFGTEGGLWEDLE